MKGLPLRQAQSKARLITDLAASRRAMRDARSDAARQDALLETLRSQIDPSYISKGQTPCEAQRVLAWLCNGWRTVIYHDDDPLILWDIWLNMPADPALTPLDAKDTEIARLRKQIASMGGVP